MYINTIEYIIHTLPKQKSTKRITMNQSPLRCLTYVI